MNDKAFGDYRSPHPTESVPQESLSELLVPASLIKMASRLRTQRDSGF